jgi:exonuclease VII small subunit
MSDMSFKQAKEIVERIELAELTLNRTLENIETSSKKFQQSLELQKQIVKYFPKADIKINTLRLALAVNVGFILGLLVGKYLL